jgi:magnesium-transporting ATPase (P-type)
MGSMSTFIDVILDFPTIFYTVLLVIIILFWSSSILGLADIDILDGDADLEAETATSTLATWLNKFKLDGIPFTITLSLIILCSWILSFLGVYFIYPHLSPAWVQAAIGFWLLILTPVLSAIIISPMLQPIKPLFKKQMAQNSQDLLGKTAIVRSGKVTANFGEGTLDDGAAGLILRIRKDEPNDIQRGDKVVLQSYTTADNSYQIQKIN